MSHLLPQTHTEFGSADYWERFFKKRGNKAFEWYGEYPELCSILHKYIKTSDRVLTVGCGNSNLSADLYDVGYHNIVNIDISDTVIRQMNDKNAKQRPEMKFLQMDMMQMSFNDGEFSVVLDKGTLDAIMTDNSVDVNTRVDQMFSEISRVLRVGGRYICVSLAQEHILNKILTYFPDQGWPVRVCRVIQENGDSGDEDKDFTMPVFVYILTRFKKMANMKQILEVSYFDDKVERRDSVQDVIAAVKEMQHYGVLRNQLSKGSHIGEGISVDLLSSESNTPRYTLHIVDSPKKFPNKFGIFIVPEGRETEWMFSTDEGRREVSKTAGFQRLVIVTLHRDHTYDCMESIKAELSSKVMELAPYGLGKAQVPFLSLGDEINAREVRYKGCSELSGDFVVEDVESEGDKFRRLVFLSSKNTVQSEARLITSKVKKKGGKARTKLTVDPNLLSMGYYSIMVAGLAFLDDFHNTMEGGVNLLLVGLGGGGLPLFIHNNFQKVNIEVVEIDPAVVAVARDWFGFVEDNRLEVHVADGLQYIQDLVQQEAKRHVVILDVDSKDIGVGMSCPPKAFVEPEFLKCIDALLEPTGVFILNLVCRNQTLRDTVISQLKSVFKQVYCKKVAEDVNECVYCLPSHRKTDVAAKAINSSLKVLQQVIQMQSGAQKKTLHSLTLQLDGLKLL